MTAVLGKGLQSPDPSYILRPSPPAQVDSRGHGGVAERSMAHAWKVCIRQKRIVGSNPTPSANLELSSPGTADFPPEGRNNSMS